MAPPWPYISGSLLILSSVMDRALVSLEICRKDKGVVLYCNGTDDFEADPDIAGQGVINVFAGVTFLACVVSAVYLCAQIIYILRGKDSEAKPDIRQDNLQDNRQNRQEVNRKEDKKDGKKDKPNWSTVIEKILISLSDQQLFTGLAYALAPRYYQGCMISAYHYDIVTNMLLMTCATHLVVVAAVSRYFDRAWVLALLRILLIFVVFVLTGFLFTNADAAVQPPFPIRIEDSKDILFTYPAVCFQSKGGSLIDLITSASNDTAIAVLQSRVNNTYVQNMNLYIVAMLAYGFAIIRLLVALLIFCLRALKVWPKENAGDMGLLEKCLIVLRFIAQVIMLVVGIVVAIFAYVYISALRHYMNWTGYLIKDHINPESTATTFGQLVPIFLTLLTVFTIIENFSEKAGEPLYIERESKVVAGQPRGQAEEQESGNPRLESTA